MAAGEGRGMEEAFVTLATNDTYALGCLVLGSSLRRVNTTRQLVVMVTSGVSGSMRAQLGGTFDQVVEVNVLDSSDSCNLELLGRPDLSCTFTKFHCWRLTQFKKCVFMDADTLVVQNIDELFDRDEFSAAPDAGWPDCFNSGVFVFRPSEDTYRSLLSFAVTQGSFDGGDQGLLNLYFKDWATADISKHLPFTYNVVSQAFYSYLPAFKQFYDNIKVVHFIGAVKPWHHSYNTATHTVNQLPNTGHSQEFLQMWWNIFMESVQPSLDPQLGGIIGDLATLSLNEGKDIQLRDDRERKLQWEQGQADYLGVDRFDNIMARLDQKIAQPTPSGTKLAEGAAAGEAKVEPAKVSQTAPTVPEPPKEQPAEVSATSVKVDDVSSSQAVFSLGPSTEQVSPSPSSQEVILSPPPPSQAEVSVSEPQTEATISVSSEVSLSEPQASVVEVSSSPAPVVESSVTLGAPSAVVSLDADDQSSSVVLPLQPVVGSAVVGQGGPEPPAAAPEPVSTFTVGAPVASPPTSKPVVPEPAPKPAKPAMVPPSAGKPAVVPPPVAKPGVTPPASKPAVAPQPASKPAVVPPPTTKPAVVSPPATKPAVVPPPTTKPAVVPPPAAKSTAAPPAAKPAAEPAPAPKPKPTPFSIKPVESAAPKPGASSPATPPVAPSPTSPQGATSPTSPAPGGPRPTGPGKSFTAGLASRFERPAEPKSSLGKLASRFETPASRPPAPGPRAPGAAGAGRPSGPTSPTSPGATNREEMFNRFGVRLPPPKK